MTQQDKDRRAFEAEYIKHYEPESPPSFIMGSYMEPCQNVGWRFWQAAHDHYAPKLTKEQATVALARFVALQEYHAHGFETIDSPDVYVGIAYKDHLDNARKEIEGLSVAGLRFKEEA
jgi:hypothetical protein